MNSLKIILGIALTFAISGCGMPRVYKQVHLGEPLPADLGLIEMTPKKDQPKTGPSRYHGTFTIGDCYVWYIPYTASLQRVTVFTDAHERVVVRVHDSVTATHLLFASNVSTCTTTELVMPADLAASPEQATLGDLIPNNPHWFHSSLGSNDAALSLMCAGWGINPLCILESRNRRTRKYMKSIPLSSVLKSGYRQRIMVNTGGFVTVTNLGDNRLLVHTSQSLLMDPLRVLNAPLVYFEGRNRRPPHWERGDE
jgi:hypothetical protein